MGGQEEVLPAGHHFASPAHPPLPTCVSWSHLSAMRWRHMEVSQPAAPPRPRMRHMVSCAPWACIISGTRQMLLTSCIVSTCAAGTWQNEACSSAGEEEGGGPGEADCQGRATSTLTAELSWLPTGALFSPAGPASIQFSPIHPASQAQTA